MSRGGILLASLVAVGCGEILGRTSDDTSATPRHAVEVVFAPHPRDASNSATSANVRGGDCPLLTGMFVARFDQNAACIDAVSYGPTPALTPVTIALAESNDDLYLAGHAEEEREVVAGIPATLVHAGEAFVRRLDPAGNWSPERSWFQTLSGTPIGKSIEIAAMDSMGDELLVGLSLTGHMEVDDLTITPMTNGAALDFESVTQEPFMASQWDAGVARIAP